MKGSACMKIYFDKKPGKVYDLTASLFFAFNYDYYLKDLDMYYLPYNEKYKQMLKEGQLHWNISKCAFKPL